MLKDTHIQYTGTGKVRYIKSIGWCFWESAVSGHSCATSGVTSTMPFTAIKFFTERECCTNQLFLLQMMSTLCLWCQKIQKTWFVYPTISTHAPEQVESHKKKVCECLDLSWDIFQLLKFCEINTLKCNCCIIYLTFCRL